MAKGGSMMQRRVFLSSVAIGTATTISGCAGFLGPDKEDLDEEYVEILDTYGDGETDFSNAVEDYESGENHFQEERYSDAEIRFRDAESGFNSARESFRDAKSLISELDGGYAEVGDSWSIASDAEEAATEFAWAAKNLKNHSIQAQSDPGIGKMVYEATQLIIEDEEIPREVPTESDLMDEFIT